MKILIRALALISAIVIFSCEDEGSDFCVSNQQSVQTGFYSASSSTDKDTSVTDLVIYPLGFTSTDTITANKLFLPLNMHRDTTEYIIEINKRKDTVSFVYQKELNFVSGECGFIFSFYLDSVFYSDRSFIDTVIIDNEEIIYNENFENVKIYLYKNS